MLKYSGSGKYWTDHYRKHGQKYIETIWYCLFYDRESVSEFALMCSEQWDIVNACDIKGNKIWANFKYENGIEGGSSLGDGNGVFGKRWKWNEEKRLANCEQRKNEPKRILGPLKEEHLNKLRGPRKPYGSPKNPRENLGEIKCPHCNTIGGVAIMKRWHFDNCIHNPNYEESNESRKITECPHCNKIGVLNSMKRWHFDNCKMKDINVK